MSDDLRRQSQVILRRFADRLLDEAPTPAISSERLTETVLALVEKAQGLGDIDSAARLLEHFGPQLQRESHLERLDANYAAVLAHEDLPGERHVNLAEQRARILTRQGRRAEAEDVLAAAWPHAQTHLLAGRLYNRRGYLLWSYDEYEAAQAAFQSGLAAAQAAGDLVLVCTIRNNLGELYYTRDQFEQAVTAFTEAIAVAVQLDHPWLRGLTEGGLAMTLDDLAQHEAAVAHHQAARRHYQLANDPSGLLRADLNQSFNAYARGDYPLAKELATRALVQARASGDLDRLAMAHQHLGEAHLGLCDYELAYEHFHQALEGRLQMGKLLYVATTCRTLRQLAAAVENDPTLAETTRLELLRKCRESLTAAQEQMEPPPDSTAS